ncbi:MAG: F0F1 ATP synthase subunit A [Patescibacteria group bacterium]|nr:F0F1 ATP synthase subunit A [Patescibacteria group bacterium]
MIRISFKPEYVASVLGVPVSNSLLTTVIVTVVIVAAALLIRFDRRGPVTRVARFLMDQMLRIAEAVSGDRQKALAVLPLAATFFVFIVTANLLALLPGFLGSFYVATPDGQVPLLRSPNSDLNTTVALALFSVIATQYYSWRRLGASAYARRFFDVTSFVRFIRGFFETISEGVKILSFSFRLFGNIFAGEVLLLVIAFLVPYLIPVPFMILEVFIGIIQAFIFAMLTLSFIRTASVES